MVNTYRQEEWYASAAGTREIAPWCELGLAVDVAYNALSSGNYNFPYPSRLSLWGALSAMVRRERLTAQVNLLWLGVDERVRSGLRPADRRVFCPVASLSWQPFRGRALRARAFYKRSFRLPTFNDIYYAFPAAVSLRPEFTTQYDAGLAWERTRAGFLASVAVQGDFYYNRGRDKIIALPAGNIARWSMLNLGRATITGTEINARLEMAPGASTRLDVGLTYTWQRAVDDTPGDTRGCRLPYSPEHAGTVTAAARRGDWRLNYSFIYTGEHFSGRDNAPGDRERPWYTHDLSLGYRHAWRGMAFRLDAEVNNLLNQRYDVVRYYPMPGRSCRLNLSIII
jgi:outer membrane receptor protein involved in Fe transport